MLPQELTEITIDQPSMSITADHVLFDAALVSVSTAVRLSSMLMLSTDACRSQPPS